jgi:hypothetical protein
MQQPSVGRIVHYVSHGSPIREDGTQAYESVCRAAIITEVPRSLTAEPFDGCPNGTDGRWIAGLAVLNPTGAHFRCDVPYSDGSDDSEASGTWHWPERA